jgi:proline dehydrogenase
MIDGDNSSTVDRNPFKYDTTFGLMKKMGIYKMMGSNLFINHSLTAMSLSYKLFGIKLTNAVIENTAGSIFTGGVSVDDLVKDMDVLADRNIGSISMMVAEGLTNADEKTLDYFHSISMDTVRKMSEGRSEAHFAVKLTIFVSLEVMRAMSTAQKSFVHDILELNYADQNSVLSTEQLVANLAKIGVTDYIVADLNQLVEKLSDTNGQMSAVARYKAGHLFDLYEPMTKLEKQIATKIADMSESDFTKFELFKERTHSFTDYAAERNTSLYVDAEQSYLQYGIESFGQ